MSDLLRFCSWDLAALALIVVLTVVFAICMRSLKHKRHTLQQELVHGYVQESIDEERM